MLMKVMGNALKQGICWWKARGMLFNKGDVDEKQGECSLTREMLMKSMGKAL